MLGSKNDWNHQGLQKKTVNAPLGFHEEKTVLRAEDCCAWTQKRLKPPGFTEKDCKRTPRISRKENCLEGRRLLRSEVKATDSCEVRKKKIFWAYRRIVRGWTGWQKLAGFAEKSVRERHLPEYREEKVSWKKKICAQTSNNDRILLGSQKRP